MNEEVTLKVRVSQADAHYGGDLVDGAYVLGLFGDLATELLIRKDGDEGLLRAYSDVEFLAPVYAGDFLELKAKLIESGRTSRKIRFEAHKVMRLLGSGSQPSAGEILSEPQLVAKATGICVVPKGRQR